MNTPKYTGKFVVFEGIDGAGKTTLMHSLAEYYKETLGGDKVFCVSDPGSSQLGVALREMLKSVKTHDTIEAGAQMLMFLAARRQMTRQMIIPQLINGAMVFADRFAASTLAYQGFGTGFINEVGFRDMLRFGSADLVPDLNIIIDIDVRVAKARLANSADAFDMKAEEFFTRVARGYSAVSSYVRIIGPAHHIPGDMPKEVLVEEAKKIINDRILK